MFRLPHRHWSVAARIGRRLGTLFIIVLLATGLRAQGGCSLSCNQNLQVALDNTGQALVTVAMIAPNAAATCGNSLEIRLFNTQGIQLPNPLSCAQAGQTITAQVRHTVTGNSCSTSVQVVDGQPPTINCGERFLSCVADPSPASIGAPPMSDNCTPEPAISRSWFDNSMDLPCGTLHNGQPVTAKIVRNWQIHDAAGNSGGCSETIWIKQAALSDLVFPANRNGNPLPALNCDQNPNDLALTGTPLLAGQPLNPLSCDLGVTHSDQVFHQCAPAGRTVLRTWTAADFCTGALLQQTQIIKVADQTPPVVQAPAAITVGAGAYMCAATVTLTPATATDDCSSVAITSSWPFGAGLGPFANVPVGVHTVTYTALDACGNSATATASVEVIDNVPPQVLCTGSLQVGLSSTGTGQIAATALDAGSMDNCGVVQLSVSRDGGTFGAFVAVSCADIGTPFTATLRAVDDLGLENSCPVDIIVRDNLKPIVTCPPAVTLTCQQSHTDPALTGTATATDNCGVASLASTDLVNLTACNVGTVIRTYTATDESANTRSCSQTITLASVNTIAVAFPPDITVSACGAPAAYAPAATGQPVVTGNACLTPVVTFTDQVYAGTGGACQRILRKWKVIENCTYNLNTGAGLWEQTQRIDIIDHQAPVLSVPANVTVNPNQPGCTAEVTLNAATAVDCQAASITHNSSYATAPGANASGSYPAGVHTVVFTAHDGCGNSVQQSVTITVADQQPPAIVCANNVVLSIASASAPTTLDASQLNGGTTDNCTPAAQLTYSTNPSVFTCEDVGLRPVWLIAADVSGNISTCLTAVNIEAAPGVCNVFTFAVSGSIATEMDVAVNEVPVRAQAASFSETTACDALGEFALPELPADSAYILQPHSNHNWLNGVSTFDLVLISRHILGVQPLTSPYKMIAADANRSGSITTFDIVNLRKLILGVFDTVPGNTSWRFVPTDFQFANAFNPFATPFPETIAIPALADNLYDQRFTAIKVGDVNNSADAADPRGPADTLWLEIGPNELVAGVPTRVPIFAYGHADYDGLQLELKCAEGVVIRSVELPEGGLLQSENIHLRDDGITVSWDGPSGADFQSAPVILFYLNLYSTNSGLNPLQISTPRLSPEAYRFSENKIDVIALKRTESTTQHAVTIVQWRPNPFHDETVLNFNNKESQSADLFIYDNTGRLILHKQQPSANGVGEWHVRGDELPGPGFYFYKLQLENAPALNGVLFFMD